MLSNAYFPAKFRFDTAENEPAKNLQNFRKMHNVQAKEGRRALADCHRQRRAAEIKLLQEVPLFHDINALRNHELRRSSKTA